MQIVGTVIVVIALLVMGASCNLAIESGPRKECIAAGGYFTKTGAVYWECWSKDGKTRLFPSDSFYR